MAIKDWWQERQTRRVSMFVQGQLDDSLKGKPPWAMHARLLAITWGLSQTKFNEYLSSLKSGNQQRVSEMAGEISESLERALSHTREIDDPAAEECVEAISLIQKSLLAREIPDPSAQETVSAFIHRVYT